MRVYSSIGHLGRWWSARYINEPAEAFGRREDHLALRAATWATIAMQEAGVPCALRGSGTYGDRQREAEKAKASLYLSWHWNSAADPAKDYGLVLFTAGAAEYASDIADAIKACHPARRVICEPLTEKWGQGPTNLLTTFDGPACLIEPGFITSVGAAQLYEADGPERLGRAIGAALV